MNHAAKSFSSVVHPVMEKNEAFLKDEEGNPFTEGVELINDAIDYVSALVKRENAIKLSTEEVFYFYAYHVLMPTSYSLVINILTGNLPSCFRDLRLLIEFLSKAYLADVRYPDEGFFKDKLAALNKERVDGGKRRKREIDFIEEFDHAIQLDGKALAQWRKFSGEVHAPQYMDRIVENIVEKDNVPGYALVFPIPYTPNDMPELLELGNDVKEFARILKETFNVTIK